MTALEKMISSWRKYRSLQKLPDGFISRHVTKPIECLLLPFVLRLPVEPNFWTAVSLGLKILSAVWLLTARSAVILPLLLGMSLIADGFDGDVARYRRRGTFLGAFFDPVADALGTGAIAVAFGIRLARECGGGPFAALIIPAFEVLFQTVVILNDLTGVFLRRFRRPPVWWQRLLKQGYLPYYHMDFFYLMVTLAPAIGFSTAGSVILLAQMISIVFLGRQYWTASRLSPEGEVCRTGFLRKILVRIAMMGLFWGGGRWVLVALGRDPAGAVVFILPEYIFFFSVATWISKQALGKPRHPDEAKLLEERLRRLDEDFLRRLWP
ncbi:MAG: CDP-alcohol phosphatidyltransferase family protein [Candidatus Hydrogenedentota bacterium]|nr:MAG: CDP-alcohol phosphatidyltransferase family protein [Candidatus Hydrogenedentota bacterium]